MDPDRRMLNPFLQSSYPRYELTVVIGLVSAAAQVIVQANAGAEHPRQHAAATDRLSAGLRRRRARLNKFSFDRFDGATRA